MFVRLFASSFVCSCVRLLVSWLAGRYVYLFARLLDCLCFFACLFGCSFVLVDSRLVVWLVYLFACVFVFGVFLMCLLGLFVRLFVCSLVGGVG